MFLTTLALLTLLVVLLMSLATVRGLFLLKRLADIAIPAAMPLPSISIVAAARNEERNVRAGVTSLLKLDYPNLEVVFVNDRSTDRTGQILAEAAAADARLKIATVTDLPDGWLGKNNALQRGARACRGDYILFTDADVVMDPTALKRAMAYASERALDHLAIGPLAVMPGAMLNMFIVGFTIFFNLFTRPWDVRNPKSKAHVGIGAFNLIKRTVYEQIGGHEQIRLRPDDDLKLGKVIKKNGFRSDFLVGAPMISVEWYASVGELIRGLEKNSFAGCDYNLGIVGAGMLAQIWLFQWPFAALFVAHGIALAAYAVAVLLLIGMGVIAARAQRMPVVYALGLPLTSVLFVYIVLRSTILNLIRRGITWRGTFYPLALLKQNKV